MLRTKEWKLCMHSHDQIELYDMAKDPHQYDNLVGDEAYTDLLNEARAAFKKRMAAALAR